MRTVTETDRQRIHEEIKQEFPDDRVMQEIHFSRQLRLFEVSDLPLTERLQQILRKPVTA
jgi:hypothetical protein